MEDEMRHPIFREMDLKILINIGSYVKLYGTLRMSQMKLSKEPSSVQLSEIAH
jgi:hypothetical protein